MKFQVLGRIVKYGSARGGGGGWCYRDVYLSTKDFRTSKIETILVQVCGKDPNEIAIDSLPEVGALMWMEAEIHANKKGNPYILVYLKNWLIIREGDNG